MQVEEFVSYIEEHVGYSIYLEVDTMLSSSDISSMCEYGHEFDEYDDFIESEFYAMSYSDLKEAGYKSLFGYDIERLGEYCEVNHKLETLTFYIYE